MSEAHKLSDKDLLEIKNKAESLNQRQQKNEVSAADALNELKGYKKQMTDSYDFNNISDMRKVAWKDVNDLIFMLEREVGPEFGPDTPLTISKRREADQIKSQIKKMEFSPQSEAEVRDSISKFQNYGKSVHKDNPAYRELLSAYHAKKVDNLYNYANGSERNPKRDAALAKQVQDNKDNYGPEHTQALLNLLAQ